MVPNRWWPSSSDSSSNTSDYTFFACTGFSQVLQHNRSRQAHKGSRNSPQYAETKATSSQTKLFRLPYRSYAYIAKRFHGSSISCVLAMLSLLLMAMSRYSKMIANVFYFYRKKDDHHHHNNISCKSGSDRITISRSPRRGLTKLAIDGAQHSHDEVRSENHTHKRAPDAGAKAQLERMMAPEARTHSQDDNRKEYQQLTETHRVAPEARTTLTRCSRQSKLGTCHRRQKREPHSQDGTRQRVLKKMSNSGGDASNVKKMMLGTRPRAQNFNWEDTINLTQSMRNKIRHEIQGSKMKSSHRVSFKVYGARQYVVSFGRTRLLRRTWNHQIQDYFMLNSKSNWKSIYLALDLVKPPDFSRMLWFCWVSRLPVISRSKVERGLLYEALRKLVSRIYESQAAASTNSSPREPIPSSPRSALQTRIYRLAVDSRLVLYHENLKLEIITSQKRRVTKEGHQSCKTSICANIVYSKSQKSSRCARNTVKRTQQQQLLFNVWRIARPINSRPRIRKRERRIDKYPCYKYAERRPRAKHPKAVVSSHETVLDIQKDIGESSGRCMRLSRETKLAKRRQSRYLQLGKINETSESGHGKFRKPPSGHRLPSPENAEYSKNARGYYVSTTSAAAAAVHEEKARGEHKK
ncbi:unnamed protein product [Trichogramma brassicae]|uniref:Uncharacterized protein n=1 Tax=Trichogramma brassicae TaxID=86971 RepID=A0A6H5J6X3_9HYME|nr:unnamed protein product [Trichogramma brassicae]